MKGLNLLLFLTGLALFCSCKRDQLEFQRAWKIESHTTYKLNNIAFLDDTTCVIGGGSTFYSSVMLRSTDGGYTFTTDSSADAPKEMYGLGISADGSVCLSGIDGCVLQSKNKGKTWQFHRINNWLVNRGGCFFTPDTGIFVSTVLQRQCSITRVDSAFNIIDEQTFQFGLNNLYMTDANTGYAIGYGVIMKTADRGTTWKYLTVKGDNFTAMDIHGNEIWTCGSAGGIYHTTDAGDSWERLRNGNDISLPGYMLRCILFTDAMHGWAAGDDGKVMYTNNGGHNWIDYKRFTTTSLRGITRCPNGDLLFAGDAGGIYRIAQ